MSSLRAFSPTISCLALAATGLLATACDVDPIGGGAGGEGGGSESSSVSTASSQEVATSSGTQGQGGGMTSSVSTGGGSSVGGGTASPNIALFGDEIPDLGGGGSTSAQAGSGGGTGFESDRLYLFLSDTTLSCGDPFGVEEDCTEQEFRAVIGLPPEYQAVGTYDLNDPAIISNFSEWGPGDDPGVCQGGGGSFFDGSIRITLIDDQEIRAILEGTSPSNLEGAHEVVRCGGDPPEESSVIGYFPSDLPPPESGSSVSTSGPGGGAEKFILVFADHAQSCADPFGNQPGPGETHHEVVLRIPPEYLSPGVYPLSDPAIEYEIFQFEENTAATGGNGGAVGTLTILAVGPDSIELELEGTPYDYANGAGTVPRCTGE